jgi:hypothetical protein
MNLPRRIGDGMNEGCAHQRTGARGIAAALLGMLFSLSAMAQVSLVRDGEARAVVVIADTPAPTARYAAEELVGHIEKATGVTLDIVKESDGLRQMHTRVYIGDTEASRNLGLDPIQLPREMFVLRSVGNDLFIAGREDDGDPFAEDNPNTGPLFGVYEFLGTALGVRWLWPGELGTYVPKTDTVELSAINKMSAPAIQFRGFYWSRMRNFALGSGRLEEADEKIGFSQDVAESYGKALQILLRRHRLGGMDAKPPSGHAFSGWWQRYGAEHPDWFAMRKDGLRGTDDKDEAHVDMCVTNEALQDFIVSQWDGERVLLLGPVDRPGRCACDKCQAWDAPQPENPPWFAERVYATDRRAQQVFSGVTSDRYARFWKTIQEKAAKRNPNALVSISFIYENEFPAPRHDIHLGRSIYGEFVQWQDPHLRWFPMPDEAYEWVKAQWLGWQATGIRMGYRPNYLHDGYVMPHFETRQSGEFFKFAYAHGMEGAIFDSLTGQWAVHGPRLYMHMRLMSDPTLDLPAILGEYCSAFGPASGTMARYFDYWEGYAFENRMRFIKLFWDVGFRYRAYPLAAHEAFPPACFEPADALLDHALREAGASGVPPEFADRVRFIRIGLEHARLTAKLTALFGGNEAVPEANLADAKSALRELVAFRKEHQRLFFSDLLWVTSFWERPKLNLDQLMDSIN